MSCKLQLVLDMDETLIGRKENNIYPRPYLKDFLRYAFRNFETVGIWTAAMRFWFEKADREVFSPILKEINEEEGTNYAFTFVYTRERLSIKPVYFGGGRWFRVAYVKRLKKLWRQKEMPHHRDNTIVVDDVSDTYMDNYGNGVPIDPWDCDDIYDRKLVYLKIYLDTLRQVYETWHTIRHVDKREWCWC